MSEATQDLIVLLLFLAVTFGWPICYEWGKWVQRERDRMENQ